MNISLFALVFRGFVIHQTLVFCDFVAPIEQAESKPNSFEFAETQPTFATAKLWSNVY